MNFQIQYQESYSRVELLLRTFFGWLYIALPHYFILYFLGLVSNLMTFIAFFIVLITGKYPEGFFSFQLSVVRWGMRVTSSLLNLVDGYPPFSMENDWDKVSITVEYDLEKVNRLDFLLRIFFGWLYVGIPHYIIIFLRYILVFVFIFIAWWIVLFTGKYPQGMHEFNVNTLRWQTRVTLYMLYLVKGPYPPFNGLPMDQQPTE